MPVPVTAAPVWFRTPVDPVPPALAAVPVCSFVYVAVDTRPVAVAAPVPALAGIARIAQAAWRLVSSEEDAAPATCASLPGGGSTLERCSTTAAAPVDGGGDGDGDADGGGADGRGEAEGRGEGVLCVEAVAGSVEAVAGSLGSGDGVAAAAGEGVGSAEASGAGACVSSGTAGDGSAGGGEGAAEVSGDGEGAGELAAPSSAAAGSGGARPNASEAATITARMRGRPAPGCPGADLDGRK